MPKYVLSVGTDTHLVQEQGKRYSVNIVHRCINFRLLCYILILYSGSLYDKSTRVCIRIQIPIQTFYPIIILNRRTVLRIIHWGKRIYIHIYCLRFWRSEFILSLRSNQTGLSPQRGETGCLGPIQQ